MTDPKTYVINFRSKGAYIYDTAQKKAVAVVDYPTLEDEISLPVLYQVSERETDTLVGKICSYIPERKYVVLADPSSSKELSRLVIGNNNELNLIKGRKRYDITRVDIATIEEEEETNGEKQAPALRAAGFVYGFKIRSSTDSGKLYFFEKDGKASASLILDSVSPDVDYKEFLPVAFFDMITSETDKRKIKKPAPETAERPMIEAAAEDSPFVRFVKEHYNPRLLDRHFTFRGNGERERFFEYLDDNWPVILNGPTGNGKSILAEDYAYTKGIPFYSDDGGRSFRVDSTRGRFVPGVGNPFYSPGPLTLAIIFDGMFLLEEGAQVDSDEFTALNRFLETGEVPINTHLGYELLRVGKNFHFVVAGNFNENYTANQWNDAQLQRFIGLKLGYPDENTTTEILMERANGLDYTSAQRITNTLFQMRAVAQNPPYCKDLGLKGAVKVAEKIAKGTQIPEAHLYREFIINTLTTYESPLGADNSLQQELEKIIQNI